MSSDDWWARKEDYDKWCLLANITPKLDVAATADSTKCKFYFTKEDDALKKEWLVESDPVDVYCNPPLSKCKDFILKGLEQWKRHNINILFVVPTGVISRNYFKPIWDIFLQKKIDIIPIARPKFLEGGNPSKWSARNDYILVVFKKSNA